MVHIVFFDNDIAVCLKPRGVLSEGTDAASLPQLLIRALEEKGRKTQVFPVHRLDRDTEGLMVYALTAKAAAALSGQIAEGRMEKEYLTVVCGTPSKAADTLTDLLFYDRARGKTYVVDRRRKGVKEAILDYTLVANQGDRSLLRVRLHTGRTHQIRTQFASRGLPVAGDRRYGAPAESGRMTLYCHRLRFAHPRTGESMSFVAVPTEREGCAWEFFDDELTKINTSLSKIIEPQQDL